MKLTQDQLNATLSKTAEAYWWLAGYSYGRGIKKHPPPPFFPLKNYLAWNRGIREGLKWSAPT